MKFECKIKLLKKRVKIEVCDSPLKKINLGFVKPVDTH